MNTLIAKITDNGVNLENAAKYINRGRTDSTYFYVNGNNVSVSNPYGELSAIEQIIKLEWFLEGRIFELVTK
tara:strand:+ start:463 stop:678 length:216 start_codon:yes stop_codon:yes gene_type:complete